MVKKVMKKIICIAMCCIVFTGCMSNNATHSSALPDIDQFSDDLYDPGEFAFPPVVDVFYTHDDVTEELPPDDPRVYRLLNALSFSYEKGYTAWVQGHMRDEEFQSCIQADIPMIDISFSTEEQLPYNTEFATASRIVISANCYLLLPDVTQSSWMEPEGVYANQHYPFATLLEAHYKQTGEKTSSRMPDAWGDNAWLDLLKYAGF